MLTLVRRIVADLLGSQQSLARLHPERDRLVRNRMQLAWGERARRYEIEEEMQAAACKLRAAQGELEKLGVAVLDAATGLVGFPTIVNNRRAFFSWKPGEDGLTFWNFAGDLRRRPVPAAWTKESQEKVQGQGRKKPKK
jgi:hypothetical protein